MSEKKAEKKQYTVLRSFHDLEDNAYLYKADKPYPREGVAPTPERIEALRSAKNKFGAPLIK